MTDNLRPIYVEMWHGKVHEVIDNKGNQFEYDWCKSHHSYVCEYIGSHRGNTIVIYPYNGMTYWAAPGIVIETDPKYFDPKVKFKRLKRLTRKFEGGRILSDAMDVSYEGHFFCEKCDDVIIGNECCEHSRWCEQHSMFCYPGEVCCWVLEDNQYGEPIRWMRRVGNTIGEKKLRHHPRWYKFRSAREYDGKAHVRWLHW